LPGADTISLRAMRSERAGGQSLLVHEIRHGFLVPSESLLGICFWREGVEAAFGPEQRGTARKLLLAGGL
jgi:hypothetical protein